MYVKSKPGGIVERAEVAATPLDITEHEDLVDEAAAGAIVSFAGVVRNHDGGRRVQALEYSAHPDAAQILHRIAAEVAARAAGVRRVAVSHRVGELEIGEAALACAVSAEHRAQAFGACAELVEEVKRQLPVWKFQRFEDGASEWVLACAEAAP